MKPVSAPDYIQSLYRLLLIQTGDSNEAQRRLNKLLSSLPASDRDYPELFRQIVRNRETHSVSDGLSGLAGELHRLPEPNRTASVLHYLGIFDDVTIAQMLQVPVEQVSSLIYPAKDPLKSEAPRSPSTELQALALEPHELQALIGTSAQEPSASTSSEESEVEEEKSHAKPRTIMIAVGIGLLATIAMIAFIVYEQMNGFTGKDQVINLLNAADNLHQDQFENVQMDAKDLEDYFFLKHNLEHFTVPKEFLKIHTVGCRVFNYNGVNIAQVEATGEKPYLFYIFHPAELGIKVKHNKWAIVPGDKLVGAVTTTDDIGFILAFEGKENEIRKVLKDAGVRQ